MIKNLKNKKKGFTLIELIIVIAIIAILAAVAIPKFGEVRKNASLKTDIANAKTIANAATALIAEENLVDGTYFVKQGEINAIANKPAIFFFSILPHYLIYIFGFFIYFVTFYFSIF